MKIPYKYLKWTLYVAVLLLAFTLQQTKGALPVIAGARPVLLIPFAICVAMYEGDTYGGAFGLITGLLWDFSANRVLGFNAVLLMLAGVACGIIITYLMQNNIFSSLILCGGAVFLLELFDWFFYYLLWGYDKPLLVFFQAYIPTMMYSMLFVPVFHYFFKWAKQQLK